MTNIQFGSDPVKQGYKVAIFKVGESLHATVLPQIKKIHTLNDTQLPYQIKSIEADLSGIFEHTFGKEPLVVHTRLIPTPLSMYDKGLIIILHG